MAVLVEAVSVVIRRDAIDAKYAGGYAEFLKEVPNGTLCADQQLARVGFMVPEAAEAYAGLLVSRGLQFLRDGAAQDFVIVDQLEGPTASCTWIEVIRLRLRGLSSSEVSACRLLSDSTSVLAVPDGWQFEGSISQKQGFIPTEELQQLVLTRQEGDLDVYVDPSSGSELFVASARTVRRPTARSS